MDIGIERIGYYGFLATRVPPQRLVGSALRKAVRATRDRLAVAPASPGRDELLAGLRCGTIAGLAAATRTLRQGALVAPDAPPALAAALRRFFPGEAERVAARAVSAARGQVVVHGRMVNAARPHGGTDWQRDPVHGGCFAAWAPSTALPPVPGSDIKNVWAVGRGEQWVALACGAFADAARAAPLAAAYADSVRDFAAQNPLGRGAQWACAMEAALRAVCLFQAHGLLASQPALAEPGYLLDAARLAVSTGRFVLARLEDDQTVPNNHLAADWLGLLACALALPAWPEAARWRSLAVAGLQRELAVQTHLDGTSFEGSVPYHRLALEIFTVGGALCRRARIPLGGAYWRRLAAMYRAARALLSASGALPQLGDNDSGRVLAFTRRASLDGGYLLPLGAATLGDASLLVRPGAAAAEEALWCYGAAAVERLAHARPGPGPASASFPQGGFHVLRRGSVEVAISCGPSGQRGLGGHSHNDKLAFELRAGGRLAICDPGTFCYTADPAARNLFRSTRSHATIAVDGLEQSPLPAGRLFALPDQARAEALLLESSAAAERFVGEHRGYARVGVVHRRELLLRAEGLLVIDHLLPEPGAGEASREHRVEVRFPAPGPHARARSLTAAEQARLETLAREGGVAFPDPRGVELGPPEAPVALVALPARAGFALTIEPSTWSPGYGEAEESRTVNFAGRVSCPATLAAAVLPFGAEKTPEAGVANGRAHHQRYGRHEEEGE